MIHTFGSLIYLLTSLSLVPAREIRPRVVGGVEDVDQEFPFAVMIQLVDPPMFRTCSGSLITLSWVLTADHCTPNIPDTNIQLRVKYGDTKIPSNQTKFYANVIKGVRHPRFKYFRQIQTQTEIVKNDIGLMKIERISNTPTAKLSAVDHSTLMGLPVRYAGFGRSKLLGRVMRRVEDMDYNDIDPPLLVGEAVVIACGQDRDLGSSKPGICLAPRCGPRQQAYYGDSGGPLVLFGRVIGVASLLLTEDESTPLVVYAPVSPYLEWIYNTVHSD